jgi:hypothetical protein
VKPTDPPSPSSTQRDALPLTRRLAASSFPLLWRSAAPRERMPMTGWFDPAVLLRTALESLAGAVVGSRSDKRVVQALSAGRVEYYDYSVHYVDEEDGPRADPAAARDELWIDYIADTGDGFNPTYAIAYAASQPQLRLGTPPVRTERGQLLLFGGDQVYPTASRKEYQRRLVAPFEAAQGHDPCMERPHVYALPGNHDWYDGLTAFTRLFCSNVGGRRFGACWSRQSRSYFALKLPARWWLIGSDGQLQSDIDTPQIEYFREIARQQMQPGDRVILCLAAPVWIYAHKYRQFGAEYDETDLLFLRERVFEPAGVTVQVYLSGDLHHYRRHEEVSSESDAPVQKITAGGGGAFLHPTHDEDVSEIEEQTTLAGGAPRRFRLAAVYPDLRTSSRLTYGNVLFALRNPAFGIVPAVLYLMTAWLVGAAVGYQAPSGALDALSLTAEAFIRAPGLALWIGFLIGLFVLFTDTHSTLYRWLAGSAHALAHWIAIFYLGWAAWIVSGWLLPAGLMRFACAGALIFAGGWIVGSLIMGLYLLISLNVFGRHSEEAFSAMKIQDYKHFLRLHIAHDGSLTIFPVKVERVPRRWRDRTPADLGPSLIQPQVPLRTELIESPIVVPARRSAQGAGPSGGLAPK